VVVEVGRVGEHGAGDVDRPEVPLAVPQEAVDRASAVDVVAHDRAVVVDAERLGPDAPGTAILVNRPRSSRKPRRSAAKSGLALVSLYPVGDGPLGARDVYPPDPAAPIAQEAVQAPGRALVVEAHELAAPSPS
jgi:hypothetical protein